jgi:uncharacterized RDD family membrane protein YckC
MPCQNHPLVEEGLLYCSRCGRQFCADCRVEIGGFVQCADCKQEVMRDLRAGLPAGPPGALELASVGRRFAALVIDSFVIGLPLMALLFSAFAAVGLLKPSYGKRPIEALVVLGLEGGFWLLMIVGWILYEGLMLRARGQTVGKRVLGLKVVSPGGARLTGGQAFGRAAMRQLLAVVPCLGLVNYLFAFGPERTCIHDMAARSRVITWIY